MITHQNLAPNEIQLENGDIHTLVEGYHDWSYTEYDHSWSGKTATRRDRSVYLHYQGQVILHLKQQKKGFVVNDTHSKFADLPAVVKTYAHTSYMHSIEAIHAKAGRALRWCRQRGTPLEQRVVIVGAFAFTWTDQKTLNIITLVENDTTTLSTANPEEVEALRRFFARKNEVLA